MFTQSIILMWDEPSVMYNIAYKIIRYIVLAVSVVFNIIYICFFINLMELIYSGDIWEYSEDDFETILVMRSDLTDEDTWALYDIFSAMVTVYGLIAYLPTFVYDLVI